MPALPRVLVIDDDALFRNVIAALLQQFYAVTTAESGSQGFQMALEQPPHVALIDVRMPGWSGLETLQKFREEPRLSSTKIAMLTGDASRETVMKAVRAGANEYLVKSNFHKEELLLRLQSLAAASSLPVEAESPAAFVSDQPADHPPEEPLPATQSGNEADPHLQELIDGWE